MRFAVVTFATYQTSTRVWSKGDYDAHDFVRALKGEAISEYSWLKVRGHFRKFDNRNLSDVVSWFGEMAADYLKSHGPQPPYVLVPVPSSLSDVTLVGLDKSARIAKAIQPHLGPAVSVRDVLRFDRPMVPSRKGGSRAVGVVWKHLRLLEAVRSERVVLVDDVLVTGAHLRACAEKLVTDGGAAEILMGICGARAVRVGVDEPFCVRRHELAD